MFPQVKILLLAESKIKNLFTCGYKIKDFILLGKTKIFPNFYLQQIGGHYNIRSNFDKQSIPRNIPKFYRTCLYTWSKYTNKNPENVNEICIQPIWNNSKILVNKKSIYIKDLDKLGIKFVNDIVSEKGKLRKLTSFANRESEEYCKFYLSYLSIVKSIPEEWKKKLQEYNTESKISISDEFLGPAGVKQICKLTSKTYTILYLCTTVSVLPSKNWKTILNFER